MVKGSNFYKIIYILKVRCTFYYYY